MREEMPVSVASQGFRVGSPPIHWHNCRLRVSQAYLVCVLLALPPNILQIPLW